MSGLESYMSNLHVRIGILHEQPPCPDWNLTFVVNEQPLCPDWNLTFLVIRFQIRELAMPLVPGKCHQFHYTTGEIRVQ